MKKKNLGSEIWEGKKYRNTESENLDAYMKALGVGFILRKIGNAVKPTVELRKNGDQYSLYTFSTFKNMEIHFELGKEFPEETGDGRKVMSFITMDGNIMTHKQTGKPPTLTTFDFRDKEMIATMTAGDATAIRKYVVD